MPRQFELSQDGMRTKRFITASYLYYRDIVHFKCFAAPLFHNSRQIPLDRTSDCGISASEESFPISFVTRYRAYPGRVNKVSKSGRATLGLLLLACCPQHRVWVSPCIIIIRWCWGIIVHCVSANNSRSRVSLFQIYRRRTMKPLILRNASSYSH